MSISIYMPTRYFFGRNAIEENKSVFAEYGTNCLIVTGKTGAKKSGALDDIISALTESNISYTIFNEIGENPLISTCFKAGEKARECKADFLIGIGGGSALDASKAIAIYASNPSLAPLDIYKRKYDNAPLPVILVGTTAGTGSEVTGVSVLTNDETGIKKSISGPDCYAKISFCDPKYTEALPYYSTVSTALDAFAHAVEGFFTEKCEGTIRIYADKAIRTIYECLVKIKSGKEINASMRDDLYFGSIYAGLVINTCGTAFPHPLGYVLTENFGIPHGMACAAFEGSFLDRCAEYAPEKMNDFIELTDSLTEVKEILSTLTELRGVKISNDQAHIYSERWETAIPKNFKSSPGGLTREEAEKILAGI